MKPISDNNFSVFRLAHAGSEEYKNIIISATFDEQLMIITAIRTALEENNRLSPFDARDAKYILSRVSIDGLPNSSFVTIMISYQEEVQSILLESIDVL